MVGNFKTQGRPFAWAITAVAIIVLTASPALTASAFVRVNEAGYPARASKRAYQMASGSEAGATFNVKNSGGTTEFTGAVGVRGPNSFAAKGTLGGMMACPPNGIDTLAQFNGNGAVYQDNVQSYSTVEPAIDLTASSPLAFSWWIAGAPAGTP